MLASLPTSTVLWRVVFEVLYFRCNVLYFVVVCVCTCVCVLRHSFFCLLRMCKRGRRSSDKSEISDVAVKDPSQQHPIFRICPRFVCEVNDVQHRLESHLIRMTFQTVLTIGHRTARGHFFFRSRIRIFILLDLGSNQNT